MNVIGPISKTDWKILTDLKSQIEELRFNSEKTREREDKKSVWKYILNEYLPTGSSETTQEYNNI